MDFFRFLFRSLSLLRFRVSFARSRFGVFAFVVVVARRRYFLAVEFFFLFCLFFFAMVER